MSGFLRGWLRDEPLETCATWANACGAFAVSRLLCSPEYPTWEELQLFPEARQPASGAAQGRGASTTSIGRRRGGRSRQRLMALAIDHRDAARSDRRQGRRAARAASRASRSSRSQAAAQGRRRAAPATACCSTRPTAARRCSTRAKLRLLDRPAGRAAGLAAAALRVRPGHRRAAWSNGRSTHTHQVPRLLSSRRSTPALKARAGREKLRTLYEAARTVGRELLVEIIAGKHGPLDDDTVAPRRSTTSMRSASSPTGGSSSRSPRPSAWQAIERDHRRQRSLVPRHRAARPGSAGARARGGLRRLRRRADRQRLRRRPHDLQRRRREWLAGTIDDAAAVDDMAARFAALCRAWDERGRGAERPGPASRASGPVDVARSAGASNG